LFFKDKSISEPQLLKEFVIRDDYHGGNRKSDPSAL
jgi:hypothetical protein